MKIPLCYLRNASAPVVTTCPGCHSPACRRHGFYERKGFHARGNRPPPVQVQRCRCLNPECPRKTFSVLPPLVMPYCRFFWPHLLEVQQALASGASKYHLANLWHVSRAVLVRAQALLCGMGCWVEGLHRELSDGGVAGALKQMVRSICRKLGRIELKQRWYRHRYPLRFC